MIFRRLFLNQPVIKKIFKILLFIILLLSALPIAAYILLQNSQVQTWLTQKVAAEIASNLGTKITIDNVSVTFINRFQLRNLFVEDLNGDTLLFAPKINVNVSNTNLKHKTLTIRKLTLHDSNLNLHTDSSGIMNIRFIIDHLKKPKSKEKTGSYWKIQIRNVEMLTSEFILTNDMGKEYLGGIDYSNMVMSNLNLSLLDFEIRGDTVNMLINKLNLNEKSGFKLDMFSSNLSLAKDFMKFENVLAQTSSSEIRSPLIHFSFQEFKDFSNVIEKVNINLILETSDISFKDVSFFAPRLEGYREEFRISGNISGKVSDMLGKNIILHYNSNTQLEANFNIIGLPDFKTTFLHLDIDKFITSTRDIEKFTVPVSGKKIELPEKMKILGNITYSGKFTGYPDDFVAYGKFQTNLGEISTDILLKPDTANTLRFRGRLKTTDFMLGKMIGAEDKIKKISMNGDINGYTSQGKFNADIESTIDSFHILDYNYQNIHISGALTESSFNGSFEISDPNIQMDFSGRAKFSGEDPEYTFTANMIRLRPYYLNIYKSDPSLFMSFLLKTNFTGKNIDDINGEISLINSLFSNSENQIQVYDFNLKAENYNDSSKIIIRSDLMDGEISGKYQFTTIQESFNKLIKNYLPSISNPSKPVAWEHDENNFSYNLRFKNIHPAIVFFFSDYDIGNNSFFHGHYNPSEKNIEINGEFPLFTFKENTLTDISVKAFASGDTYEFSAKSKELILKNNMKLENLDIQASVFADTVDVQFSWNNRQIPGYSGQLDLVSVFGVNSFSGNKKLKIHTKPSAFIFNDTLWNISESIIEVDSNSIAIDTFGISNHSQDFYVFGNISRNPADTLFMKFSDMDIALFNIFTKRAKIIVGGHLSGEASLQDAMNKPIFLSDLIISGLHVNNENLGQAKINARWNNSAKKITLLAETLKGENKQLTVTGDYRPDNRSLDFKINLDKLRVTMFEPFLADFISDLKGMGSGQLTLKGTTKTPELNGNVNLQKTSLLVDYLMTSYYFTNDLKVVKNNIIFKDFEIFDEKGSKGVAQGTIYTNTLKSLRLDLKLTTNNFTFLNTTEKDNDLFYGQINAGGIVLFTGPIKDLTLDITARTDRNSTFYIPLYGAEEIYESNFIQWVSQDTTGEENDQTVNGSAYEVQLKGLKMIFNLEVTPDAEVQLIFDPKVGDKMRGWGSGNLKLLINTMGKFEIYGEMIIERGDYLFTLKNLINKYFEVQRGGKISWDGDPMDANIDLQAIYRLKASVYSIAPEPMESLRKRIPVEILFKMTGKLMNPTITPDIQLPTADQETRNIVRNRISTDEEMMKQFLSLLVINNFYSDMNQGGLGGTAQRGSGIAGSELFTNQLSNWLSQISKDFDLGINYRPGDELTSDQLEVAFSTQLLNDRVRINTNLGLGGTQTSAAPASNPNNIVGDFDVDFQITESGKLHVKAFNRSNDNLLIRTSPYTQGVGFTYREDFNTFGEVLRRYKESIISLFSKDKKAKKEEEVEEVEEVSVEW